MRRTSAVVGSVSILALAVVGTVGGAVGQATRIVDRTVTCATGLQGGLRQATIQASSKSAVGGGNVWVLTNVQPTGRIATVSQGSMELSPFCRATRTTVPLSSRGLQSSIAGAFGDEWDCQVPRQIHIRLRVVFKGAAPQLRRGEPYGFPLLFANRPVAEGTLAMRTTAGKPLAVARLRRNGEVQVLTSGTCFPD
jgi:hypothetical protein